MMQQDTITAKEFFEQLVETPPDNHCRTCKFWAYKTWINHEGFAYCSNAEILHTFMARYPLIPPATFSCIFHEAKE